MKFNIRSNTLTTGLALFSMFFGAGNTTFPLALGAFAKDKIATGFFAFNLTAVLIPLLAVTTLTLFDGSYHRFFQRIGKLPGFLIIVFLMALIGPFGAIPRIIALSYSTFKLIVPNLNLDFFKIVSCLLFFGLTYKRSRILDILGYVLTPVLLVTLGMITIKGIFFSPELLASAASHGEVFIRGIEEGYNTMDLQGAFFFSSIVIICLEKELSVRNKSHKNLIMMTLKAGGIGCGLLALVYLGLAYLAALNSGSLEIKTPDLMLGSLALKFLGESAGIIVCVAVAMACLSTAIALVAVFSEFLHEEVSLKKISYIQSLIITLVITYIVSMLNFTAIMEFLKPILVLIYPTLIVITICNFLYKVIGFKWIKTPSLVTFILTVVLTDPTYSMIKDWLL